MRRFLAAPLAAAMIAAVLVPFAVMSPSNQASAAPRTVTLPDGLRYTDLKIGKGAMPKKGQTAIVHYTGTFPNGKKFDSSRDRNVPFEFALATHGVIACWDEAVATMRVGGRRKLVCPPKLAYGAHGYPPVIPPNATLNFDVELLGLR